MFRSRRLQQAAPAAPKAHFKVLAPFAHNHVMVEAGAHVRLTDAEAKYHLLAKRIEKLVHTPAPAAAPAAPAAPTPAAPTPAAPAAAPAPAAPDAAPAVASDSSKK